MKTTSMPFLLSVTATLIITNTTRLSAQNPPGTSTGPLAPVEQVSVHEGVLVALAKGERYTPTNSVAMPNEITVMTNKTFTVAGGRVRNLQEGQVLRADGNLQSPDGSLVPVIDHVVMRKGRVFTVKDGMESLVTAETRLADGSRIWPDGAYSSAGGSRSRLVDGQIFKLGGTPLPATDTATLIEGKVVLQKDGSLLTLRPAQTIMMSDGTKVFGDGRVVRKNGETSQLEEGVIVHLQGVRRSGFEPKK